MSAKDGLGFNPVNFWLSQYDTAAKEVMAGMPMGVGADQAIKRGSRVCSDWADAALDAAEERWGAR